LNPWVERTTIAASFLFTAVYLIGAAGVDIPGSGRTQAVPGPVAAFHGGKATSAQVPDPGCQSPSCHEAYPHKKDRAESAFRNMHQEFAECLACHGKEPENRWFGDPREKGGKIRYARGETKGNPHVDLGQAATCRKCHSESGRGRLREKGMAGIPPGHADPIALRMLEGGSKRWAPADLR
jgi:hypothetical protein